jgi:hypothetical protein
MRKHENRSEQGGQERASLQKACLENDNILFFMVVSLSAATHFCKNMGASCINVFSNHRSEWSVYY